MILIPLSLAIALSTPVVLVDSPVNACLSADEMHDAVSAQEAVAPALASRHARDAAPGELLRLRLCREDGVLHYLVTVLKRDGRVARVTIEASSGKVSAVR